MDSLGAWTATLERKPLLTAGAFALGSALFGTAAFSVPAGGPPLGTIVPFAVALGLGVGVIVYVGMTALS